MPELQCCSTWPDGVVGMVVLGPFLVHRMVLLTLASLSPQREACPATCGRMLPTPGAGGWETMTKLALNSSAPQFSIIIRPLFESFNGMVSTASMESLTQTSLAWLDQHCSLPALRPSR